MSVADFWARWAERGTCKLEPLYDEDGWAKYCLKLMMLDGDWLLSDDFLADIALDAAAYYPAG